MSTERLTLDSTVQRASDLLSTEVDGDLVMLSLRNNRYYGTQVTGSRIWSLLEQPILIRNVVDGLLRDFEVNRETCERETLAFLQRLADEGLLDVRAPA